MYYKRTRVAAFLVSILFSLSGCQPGTGEFIEAPETEIPPEPPASSDDLLSQIQDTIFTPICAECHVGSQAPLGLRLENTDVAYELLVDVAAVGNSTFNRVTPNDPDNSFLVLKVEGDSRAGARMPLGRAPLSSENIQLIRDWIAAGALPAQTSQVSTKVRFANFNDQVLQLEFTQPLNRATVNLSNVALIDQVKGFDFLVDSQDYQVNLLDDMTLQIILSKQVSEYQSLRLTINGPATAGLLDSKGRLLDGDRDQQPGGEYVFQFNQ